MTLSLYRQTDFIPYSCWVCGIEFAITRAFDEAKRSNTTGTRGFCCPNGCKLAFGESEADKLRKELEAKQRIIDQERRWREQAHEARRSVERQLSAAKGQATKLRQRAAGGACPCCKRSFRDMARHMKSKHPGYAGEEK